MAVVGFAFYTPIGRIFTKDPLVLEQFYISFWIILAMQPLCGITFVFDAMFKGMGEMKFLRNLLILSTGLIFIPSLLLLDAFDLRLQAIWFTFTIWMIARGLPIIIKFRRKFLPRVQKS
jgi:Na+-driven multidrug efflux pump